MAKKIKRARWSSCNVLQTGGVETRHLWTFNAGKNGFSLDQDKVLPVDGPLPLKVVARDWHDLLRPKLNLALLPFDKVFLRVIHLPVSEFNETVSMVELQMEKLSPLPVTQVVWGVQVLPHTVDNLQTIIVVIAARDYVEEFLGKLEREGFQPDRLELPVIDQLLATPITGDGAWLYPAPGTGENHAAMVAWWYGGVLRHLGLVHIAAGPNSAQLLQEQLTQMAWAGELEGWLTSPPNWHLVANENVAAIWQPMFRAWLGHPAEVTAPLTEPELAALTANHAARAEARSTILPAEFSDRYRSQYVDRLWMRGLGAVFATYVLVVMAFFIVLTFQKSSVDDLVNQAAVTSRDYTNVMVMKTRLDILRQRDALKYASLDCWKITAENLPTGFVIRSIDFAGGRTFKIQGNCPEDLATHVAAFGDTLRNAPGDDGRPFFARMDPAGKNTVNGTTEWGFSGELAHTEDSR